MTKEIKFKSDLYDYLYKRADELIKYYQPCHIHQENNGNQCIDGRLKSCCCRCKHFSKNDYCTVQALSCKLWLCTRAQDTNPILANNLIELKAIASKFNLYGFRMSKKEIFKKQFGVDI